MMAEFHLAAYVTGSSYFHCIHSRKNTGDINSGKASCEQSSPTPLLFKPFVMRVSLFKENQLSETV